MPEASMVSSLKAWWRRVRQARAAARTRRELHAVSDRLLRDIGLQRDQIDSLYR
jgi:uncharacterized protein YjiS (DUF1127 family)